MKVYQKLIRARNMLRKLELKKSGHNKFAGYQYFELGDFLPYVQAIFEEVGLCDVVYFDKDMAYMNLYDTDDGSFTVFTSPMGSAQLKGCHEVQNIGAVETYQRRYLYVTAMAIVEHDALDATTGGVDPVKKPEPLPVIKPEVNTVKPQKIVGQKGEFQIVIDEPPADPKEWLELVKTSSHMMLELCEDDADVMTIFKKNKVLFDEVKALDPMFFKDMMVKFTETKAKFAKEK
jgi:hypothetical protein